MGSGVEGAITGVAGGLWGRRRGRGCGGHRAKVRALGELGRRLLVRLAARQDHASMGFMMSRKPLLRIEARRKGATGFGHRRGAHRLGSMVGAVAEALVPQMP